MLRPEVRDSDKLNVYYSGYKKLWEEINEKKDKERKRQEVQTIKNKQHVKKLGDEFQNDNIESEDLLVEDNETDKSGLDPESSAAKSAQERKAEKKKKLRQKQKNNKAKKKIIVPETTTSTTTVVYDNDDPDFTELDLDIMIEEAEDKIKDEAIRKLRKLSKVEKLEKKKSEQQSKRAAKRTKNKSKEMMRGDADEIRDLDVDSAEQLLENVGGETGASLALTSVNGGVGRQINPDKQDTSKVIIDPNNYLKITKKAGGKKAKFDGNGMNKVEFDAFLNNEAASSGEDDDDDDDQRKLIAEAFEDDDVVDEFRLRKEEEIDALKPKDVDLCLPGWGEWGGKGIVPNPKKRKRFLIKAAPLPPRKDAALSHVILNEEVGEKVKEHLVRELPFPFKRVKDYEKTIRAPVGRTWLPEQATKDLVAPRVITRLGAIIEPLDEDVLPKMKGGSLKVPISIKRLARVKKIASK